MQTGERLHANERITIAMRAVLEFLVLRGPTTVPQIARGRYVTRQHIQELVNALVERGLVDMSDNPAHRRSRLARLTPLGEETIERIRRREHRVYRKLDPGVRHIDIERAERTLRSVRNVLAELDTRIGAEGTKHRSSEFENA